MTNTVVTPPKISKTAKVYAWFMRLVSIALLVACVYTGILGFGGSALVMGIIFLLFWAIDRTAAAIVALANAGAEAAKTKQKIIDM